MFSMMSISPELGQPTLPMLFAEHPERRPQALTLRDLDARLEPAVPLGEACPEVRIRPDVYWHVPYQHW
jgi:hypothetical protein